MRFSKFFSAFILGLVLVTFAWRSAAAQNPQPTPSDDEVNRVARTLYCPVCENISLDVCPTQACAQWRDLIRQKLTLGWNQSQIQEYFAQQYGDRVMATPPARGLNWLVYILPPLVILAGAFILFRVLKNVRLLRTASTTPPPPAPPSDPYLDRLEQELKRRKRE